jgi:Protein of unknown function (DUF2637)
LAVSDDRHGARHQVVYRVVVGVAAVAAVASYEHAYALVRAHGEARWAGRLVPLTVDGLIYASSMVMLDSARRRAPVPALARWLLGLGIAATLAANVARGLGHRPIGAAVAAPPAIALVGSCGLLMTVIRGSQAAPDGAPGSADCSDHPRARRYGGVPILSWKVQNGTGRGLSVGSDPGAERGGTRAP